MRTWAARARRGDDIIMSAAYLTSPIKRRRATNDEMQKRRVALAAIVADTAPCIVRQAYYQATVRGVVEKTEAGYGKVQRMLVEMRRDGDIAYGDIVDNTRWMRKPTTYASLHDALEQTAKLPPVGEWERVRTVSTEMINHSPLIFFKVNFIF